MLGNSRTKHGVLWGGLVVALACGGAEIEPSDSQRLLNGPRTMPSPSTVSISRFQGLISSRFDRRLVLLDLSASARVVTTHGNNSS